VKRSYQIVVLLSALEVLSWQGAAAQEANERPRFSLLSDADASMIWPSSEPTGTGLAPPALAPTFDSAPLLLSDPAALSLRPRAGNEDTSGAGRKPRTGGLSYRLADSLTAGVSYRHTLLFATLPNETLRQYQFDDFGTDRDRDVLKLDMSWDLSFTQLDLGYRLESSRADPGQDRTGRYSLLGVIPESDHALHSLTVGVTRRWGGAK
jgi:hypothetical protein